MCFRPRYFTCGSQAPRTALALAATRWGTAGAARPHIPPPLPVADLLLRSAAPEALRGRGICSRSCEQEAASEQCDLNAVSLTPAHTAVPKPFRPLQFGLPPLVPREGLGTVCQMMEGLSLWMTSLRGTATRAHISILTTSALAPGLPSTLLQPPVVSPRSQIHETLVH